MVKLEHWVMCKGDGTYDTIKGRWKYIPNVVKQVTVRAELTDDHHRGDTCIFWDADAKLSDMHMLVILAMAWQ